MKGRCKQYLNTNTQQKFASDVQCQFLWQEKLQNIICKASAKTDL